MLSTNDHLEEAELPVRLHIDEFLTEFGTYLLKARKQIREVIQQECFW